MIFNFDLGFFFPGSSVSWVKILPEFPGRIDGQLLSRYRRLQAWKMKSEWVEKQSVSPAYRATFSKINIAQFLHKHFLTNYQHMNSACLGE